MAICPRTGLTIPECSCDACLEQQIRRVMPALLDQEAKRPVARALTSRLRRWRRAA
jgi:hypothetical protein